MDRRLELKQILTNILGSPNVYFQPPESLKIKYPCIIYSRSSLDTKYANNLPYLHTSRYDMQLISRNQETEIVKALAALPMCSYDRFYTVDGLNHNSFTIYY